MNKAVKIFTLFLVLFRHTLPFLLAGQALAQQASSNAKEVDTIEIKRLFDIASQYYNNDTPDSCQKYATLAIRLANQLIARLPSRDIEYGKNCQLLKVQALELIGQILYYENDPTALDTLQAALTVWEEIGDSSGIATAHSSIATIYSDRADFSRALAHYHSSLNLYLQIGDRYNAGMTYYYIGLNQRYMGTYGDAFESNLECLQIGKEIGDTFMITKALLSNGFLFMYDSLEALKYQKEALDIFIQQNDSNGIATVYNDMGVIYWLAGNLDEALKNHQQALAIRKNLEDYAHVSSSHNYISEVLQKQGNLPLALTHIFEALKYSELGGGDFEIDSYMDAGKIYLQMGEYSNALKYYESAAIISEESRNKQRQAEALEGIAEVLLFQGKNKEALTWLQKAEKIAAADDFRVQTSIYQALSNAYVKINDYKRAYESQVRYKEMSDSLFSGVQNEKITSLNKQLEFQNMQALQKASQDQQLAVQQSEIERQKVVRNFSMAGLFFVIILALIFFIRFKEKGKLNVALESMITNLKATQTQLIQSEKMASLGELTAGIAHEIQNPLNFVNNFSEVSQELIDEMTEEINKGDREESLLLASNLKDNLEKIQRHGQRADAIVKGMLLHSRTSTGQKESTDINALCDEYLRLAYHGFRAKDKQFNAEIITKLDKDLPNINVIHQDMGRVFLNIINNGFQAVGEQAKKGIADYKPTLEIATKLEDQQIKIFIKDNGPGISDHIQNKIFQPFFTTKPSGQGTGLGLSLSYDIVKAHGGELKVESEEGSGSKFTVILPY
ncbi:MAG: tetratricopeptide repeat protein [Saprospiraceae bacterium]|nr:tetratricopeptide repeat protein [Saprospiraceae bacterium]